MTWTHDYKIGEDVLVYHQSSWCRGAVVSTRTRSLMTFLGKHGYVNVHDPRNIKPWKNPASSRNQPSTLSEPPLFDT